MSVKITRLEAEDVKRVKAVELEPTQDGLTVIGGRNNQGKTSILDAIAWALGGDKYRPKDPTRDGSATPARLHVELSNGLVVERSGANGNLKVTDPSGNKAGQRLLDAFVEKLALDIPKFMESSDKEKASTLLSIIGIGDELAKIDTEEERLYNQRTEIGRMADRKKAAAEDMTYYPNAPMEPVSASELIQQQQEILARNGDNQRKRDKVDEIARDIESLNAQRQSLKERITDLQKQLQSVEHECKCHMVDLETAKKTAAQLEDEKTDEIEASIASIDATNEQVRSNQARELAKQDAEELGSQYSEMTASIEELRTKRMRLLDGAKLPLPELSVKDSALTYKGHAWGDMSGSEQLKVATAIVRELNPSCGFVLVDKLEQMDTQTMREFAQWATEQGLQVIATRVSTGDECSIVIEDGRVAGEVEDDTEHVNPVPVSERRF